MTNEPTIELCGCVACAGATIMCDPFFGGLPQCPERTDLLHGSSSQLAPSDRDLHRATLDWKLHVRISKGAPAHGVTAHRTLSAAYLNSRMRAGQRCGGGSQASVGRFTPSEPPGRTKAHAASSRLLGHVPHCCLCGTIARARWRTTVSSRGVAEQQPRYRGQSEPDDERQLERGTAVGHHHECKQRRGPAQRTDDQWRQHLPAAFGQHHE